MQDTGLVRLLIQKTGATLGKEFSVADEDRIILDRDLTQKIVNLYLEGDADHVRVVSDDLERALRDKSPDDFCDRSIDRVLTRCRQLYSPDYGLGVAALYFWLFYGGIATKLKIEQTLAHDMFYALTGKELHLSVSARHSPDLGYLMSLVFEDVLQSAIDVRITSIERYSQLVRDRAWEEYWQIPS
jgi:hypothetical protein